MTPDELVTFAEELARIAATGGGVTALARHLAEATNCGVLVEDAQHRNIASVGGRLPGSIRGGNGSSESALVLRTGDAQLGRIALFPRGGTGEFAHPLRLAASAIAVELSRTTGRERQQSSFWGDLVAGAFHDPSAVREEAAAHGITLAPQYVVVSLEPELGDGDEENAALAAVRRAASEAFGPAQVAVERGTLVLFLVPAPREIDASNARTAASLLPRTLAKRTPATRVSGGIGSPSPAASVRTSVEQAHAALAIGRRIYGSGRVVAYDDLGAYPLLLDGASSEALRAFAAGMLEPLRTYDDKHQTELERTLRLYFDVGQNVKSAAESLHVHRHTVLYRLRQIGDICACKIDAPQTQLSFRMAMAIDALHR